MFDVWIHNNCLLSDVEKEYRAKDFLQSIFDELFELVEDLTDNIHVTISGEPRYLKIKDEVHVHQLDKKQGKAMITQNGKVIQEYTSSDWKNAYVYLWIDLESYGEQFTVKTKNY